MIRATSAAEPNADSMPIRMPLPVDPRLSMLYELRNGFHPSVWSCPRQPPFPVRHCIPSRDDAISEDCWAGRYDVVRVDVDEASCAACAIGDSTEASREYLAVAKEKYAVEIGDSAVVLDSLLGGCLSGLVRRGNPYNAAIRLYTTAMRTECCTHEIREFAGEGPDC